jgi:lysosomal acid lipase/cholesteryl ester hydrolase
MFRIRHNETPDGAPAVLLQHGLMDTADCWIMDHADESPGFVLAREGYDVWLGNNRGNRYSRKHKTLNPNTDLENFWDFSWKEMGDYDSPAMIDFVLDQTNLTNITYIGHSQGNTQMFYALS